MAQVQGYFSKDQQSAYTSHPAAIFTVFDNGTAPAPFPVHLPDQEVRSKLVLLKNR